GSVRRMGTAARPAGVTGNGGFMPNAVAEQARMNQALGGAVPGQQTIPNLVPLGSMDDGYANVSRGDELLERGDRVNALKAYMQAVQSSTLDNSTRQRVESEIENEFATRRQNADNLLKKGMLVDAQRECRILAELDPNDAELRTLLKDIETRLALKR